MVGFVEVGFLGLAPKKLIFIGRRVANVSAVKETYFVKVGQGGWCLVSDKKNVL